MEEDEALNSDEASGSRNLLAQALGLPVPFS